MVSRTLRATDLGITGGGKMFAQAIKTQTKLEGMLLAFLVRQIPKLGTLCEVVIFTIRMKRTGFVLRRFSSRDGFYFSS